MDSLNDVQDPTDFPIDSLRKLDGSFRCPICQELFDGPVVLRCGHTFCSLCIRNVLPGKPECPTCRAPAKELHIVRNTSFEEAVLAWSKAREQTLRLAKDSVSPLTNSISPRGNKRKSLQTSDTEAGPSKYVRRTNDSARLERDEDEDGDNTGDEDSVESAIACPICERDVKYDLINQHIDSACKKYVIGAADNPTTQKANNPKQKATWDNIFNSHYKKAGSNSVAKNSEIPTSKLAKVSYGTMTTGDIRKLLGERGLPTTGERQELIQRHKRWTALNNANLDRAKPKTAGELKSQLKDMEDAANRSGPKILDEKEYARIHKTQFASLIEKARPKAKTVEESTSTEGVPRPEDSVEAQDPFPSVVSPEVASTKISLPAASSVDPNVIIID